MLNGRCYVTHSPFHRPTSFHAWRVNSGPPKMTISDRLLSLKSSGTAVHPSSSSLSCTIKTVMESKVSPFVFELLSSQIQPEICVSCSSPADHCAHYGICILNWWQILPLLWHLFRPLGELFAGASEYITHHSFMPWTNICWASARVHKTTSCFWLSRSSPRPAVEDVPRHY